MSLEISLQTKVNQSHSTWHTSFENDEINYLIYTQGEINPLRTKLESVKVAPQLRVIEGYNEKEHSIGP